VQKRLVEYYYEGLVRAGAQLSDADKASLRKLNVEETTLSTQFHTSWWRPPPPAAVVVDDKAKLAGLDEDAINGAAEAAKERKLDGKFLLPLQNTTQQPVLAR
jgi:peptidyl-dipeptidase Dcp